MITTFKDSEVLYVKNKLQLWQRTLKDYAFWKKNRSALNLGPSQRTLKKINSKCINIGHINANEKSSKKEILHALLYLSSFKILKYIINFESESISSNALYQFYIHLSGYWSTQHN